MATKVKNSVSMNDVAKEAGVSLKTVSRVINEPDAVRPATREQVQNVMAKLGFRANFAARTLRLGHYGSIGVVLFSLSGGNRDVLDGITTAAAEEGYAITLIKKRADEEMTLAEASRRLSLLPVDGMIFNLGRMVSDFETFKAPADLKTVIITPLEQPNCSTVSDDQQGGAYMATSYLLNRGHKTVHFITGPEGSLSSQQRMHGWEQALHERGIEVPEPYQGTWKAQSGYEAGKRLANVDGCTAILAANDSMAYGAKVALQECGKSVPDDVSLIGFDDSLEDVVPNAGITSVWFPHAELGVRAFNEVVNGLSSPESRTRILVGGELIERASVKDLR